jgi:hypothetical protein
MNRESRISDDEFIAALRLAVERYLGAVDQWEAAYQKYYRLPGYAATISHDLETEHRAYCDRRRELQEMLPRARRLCLKHQLRDPFSGLPRISLGRYAPQHRVDSAIGRNERSTVTECLVELSGACQDWETEPQRDQESLLRRLADYFD